MPDFLDEALVQGSFGLAKYFIYMPWVWARFNAASLISGEKTPNGERPRGVPLELLHKKDSLSKVAVEENRSDVEVVVVGDQHNTTVAAIKRNRRRRRHRRR